LGRGRWLTFSMSEALEAVKFFSMVPIAVSASWRMLVRVALVSLDKTAEMYLSLMYSVLRALLTLP
jgi:hypothetical protein